MHGFVVYVAPTLSESGPPGRHQTRALWIMITSI